jgi:hypothetical protein
MSSSFINKLLGKYEKICYCEAGTVEHEEERG